MSRFFTGKPTEKAMWLLPGGIAATTVGAVDELSDFGPSLTPGSRPVEASMTSRVAGLLMPGAEKARTLSAIVQVRLNLLAAPLRRDSLSLNPLLCENRHKCFNRSLTF